MRMMMPLSKSPGTAMLKATQREAKKSRPKRSKGAWKQLGEREDLITQEINLSSYKRQPIISIRLIIALSCYQAGE
jgi:hypothetical protein